MCLKCNIFFLLDSTTTTTTVMTTTTSLMSFDPEEDNIIPINPPIGPQYPDLGHPKKAGNLHTDTQIVDDNHDNTRIICTGNLVVFCRWMILQRARSMHAQHIYMYIVYVYMYLSSVGLDPFFSELSSFLCFFLLHALYVRAIL